MGWFRVQLTPSEQETVYRERESHADPLVRRKLWTLSLLHAGLTRETAAKIQGLDYATIERHAAEFRDGGLDATCRSVVRYQPRSELADHEAAIREAFANQPPRTVADACRRIEQLTGLVRKPTQVRTFLKRLGMTWRRVRAIPVPPKKTCASMSPNKPHFTMIS